MRSSQDNEKHKPAVRKARGMKTSGTKAQQAQRDPEKTAVSPVVLAKSTSITAGPVLTQEEYSARVARKAFELYEKRRALTEVDDWVEAERLVKLQLLSEQRGTSA